MRNATVAMNELAAFNRDTDETIFLFDVEVKAYLRMLQTKAVKLYVTHLQLADLSSANA